jgi:Nuclease-related domain
VPLALLATFVAMLGWAIGRWPIALMGAALAVTAAAGWEWQHAEVASWRRGARGERKTARLLAGLEGDGFRTLHDRGLPPGDTNIDHLVVGPTGVFVVDSKVWRRRPWLNWRGELWIGTQHGGPTVAAIRYETREVSRRLAGVLRRPMYVTAVMVVHGSRFKPLFAQDLTVVPARQLRRFLQHRLSLYAPDQVQEILTAADRVLPPKLG